MLGVIYLLPKSLQRQVLIDIKNKDNNCFIWSYIRYLNPHLNDPIRIKLTDKNYLMKYIEN